MQIYNNLPNEIQFGVVNYVFSNLIYTEIYPRSFSIWVVFRYFEFQNEFYLSKKIRRKIYWWAFEIFYYFKKKSDPIHKKIKYKVYQTLLKEPDLEYLLEKMFYIFESVETLDFLKLVVLVTIQKNVYPKDYTWTLLQKNMLFLNSDQEFKDKITNFLGVNTYGFKQIKELDEFAERHKKK
jgi:hypothetical protein